MWEYKMVYVRYRMFLELTEELNKWGKEDWEVIHFEEEKPEKYGNEYNAKVLFKRLKKEPA